MMTISWTIYLTGFSFTHWFLEIPYLALIIMLWSHRPSSLSLPLGYHSCICTLPQFFFTITFLFFRGDECISAGPSTKWYVEVRKSGSRQGLRSPQTKSDKSPYIKGFSLLSRFQAPGSASVGAGSRGWSTQGWRPKRSKYAIRSSARCG